MMVLRALKGTAGASGQETGGRGLGFRPPPLQAADRFILMHREHGCKRERQETKIKRYMRIERQL